MQKLGDVVSERAVATFAGRAMELEALLHLFEPGGPLAIYIHGVAGIGKSSLLDVFATRVRKAGGGVVRIDCRTVEPTVRGFLTELSGALGAPPSTVEEVVERLSSFDGPIAITLDTFEAFLLMDTWIRQVFIPLLPMNARVAIASRNPPSPAWRTTPGWQGLFRSLLLEPLSEAEALGYLMMSGVAADAARQINLIARGHPLALNMATSIVLSDARRTVEEAGHQVIEALSRSYIEAVPDLITRRALEASSVVRCVTEPLLHALLPDMPPRDGVERLAALPFVEPGRDGLFIHDAVRTALAGTLATRDPDAHRAYRRAAWAFLQSRLVHGKVEPWRYTADLLFLIQNPVIREAFFPSGPQPLDIEPARPDDEQAVQQIVAATAAPEYEALLAWWRYHPDGFRFVRDRNGSTRGFCVRIRASDLHDAVVASDPVAAAWRSDVARRDPSAALLCRRWLDRDVGEAPCDSLAAFFVDLKRSYVEMRGTLRWVYSVVANPKLFGDLGARLGFRPLADAATTDVGGQIMYSAMLDMGPGSVDAWLAKLMGAEITKEEIESSKPLDVEAHELVLSSGRVGLTSLEFGVMRYLQERPGKAVGRYDLMEAVWGSRSPTASNVVDVVVRSLRRKLGTDAACVETVRGTGYRYRVPNAPDRPESGRPRAADHGRRSIRPPD